ncbi:hypothetical protein RI129_011699 [Pyrocoelia pectoralis]|uniref:THAP-type domain-containing protein n=1 Tax=Pyrocoelia pectoralis TaxID=417401 RepID=A0AAN7V0L9_9COLE
MRCAVAGCHTDYQSKNYTSDLMFFRFPKDDENLSRTWVNACKLDDKINVKNGRICSKHFDKDCYERNVKFELLGYSARNQEEEHRCASQRPKETCMQIALSRTIENMGNPFCENISDFLVLDSRNVADAAVVDTVQKLEKLGRDHLCHNSKIRAYTKNLIKLYYWTYNYLQLIPSHIFYKVNKTRATGTKRKNDFFRYLVIQAFFFKKRKAH